MTASPDPSAEHHLPEAVLRPVRGHHAFEACVEQLGHGDPARASTRSARTLPPERELAERARASPGPRCARRWRRCARPDWSRPPAAAAAARSSTLKPRTPSARAAARVSAERRADWLDALDFRRIVEPGAAWLAAERRADRRTTRRSWSARTPRSPTAARAGRAPAGRLPLPPHGRRRSPARRG